MPTVRGRSYWIQMQDMGSQDMASIANQLAQLPSSPPLKFFFESSTPKRPPRSPKLRFAVAVVLCIPVPRAMRLFLRGIGREDAH
jgi:hypothetical protein